MAKNSGYIVRVPSLVDMVMNFPPDQNSHNSK